MSEPAHVTKADDSHGHGSHGGSFGSHVKPYIIIGVILGIFTLITVGLAYVDFAKIGIFKWAFGKVGLQGHAINMVIGLAVATFKVLLVAAWFMHLKGERSTIWHPLLFTLFFFAGLFALCLLHYTDPIMTTTHTSKVIDAPRPHHH